MNKALNYIGLAKKAGSLVTGETDTGAAVRAGKCKLLVLASDASENAVRRAENFVYGTRATMITLPFTKAELSQITGRGGCAMAAFTDIGLTAAFTEALSADKPEYRDTAELITSKNDKAKMRKREALIHAEKLKKGGTAGPAATGKRRKNI